MPEESIYRRQTGSRPTEALPLTRPEDFGAGLAGQVAEQAQQLDRINLRDYQLERERAAREQLAAGQHAFAQARTGMDVLVREAQQNYSPDHVQNLEKFWQDKLGQILAPVTEDSVRQQLTASAEDWAQRYLGAQADWADAMRVGQTLKDYGDAESLAAGRARESVDPQTFPDELQIWHDGIDALPIPYEKKLELHQTGPVVLTMSAVRGLTDRDPDSALAQLRAHNFDYIGPERVNQLINEAETAKRSQENAARTQAAVTQRATESKGRLFIEQVNDGRQIDPDAAAALREEIVAAGGDEALLYDFDNAIETNNVNREFRNAEPPQIAGEIARIDAELAGQANGDPKLVARRNALAQMLPRRREEIGNDPLAWAARNGLDVAPFSLQPSGADVRGWIAAAEGASGSSHRPPQYIPRDGAETLRALALSGKEGMQQVFEYARYFGEGRAGDVMRQLFPGKEGLAWVVTLPPESRALVLSGRQALKDKTVSLELTPEERDALQPTFDEQDREFDIATRGLDPAQKGAIAHTAAEILAGFMHEGEPLTTNLRWRAFNQALGASGVPGGNNMRGGIHRWGTGDHFYVAPKSMTGAEFHSRVQQKWVHDPPRNRDGSPVYLTRVHPIRVGPLSYRFEDAAGHPAMRADRKTEYVLDLSK